MRKVYILFIAIFGLSCSVKTDFHITSPNDVLQFHLLEKEGVVFYTVLNGTDTLIRPSALGLKTERSDFVSNVSLEQSGGTSMIDQRVDLLTGNRSSISTSYRHGMVKLKSPEGTKLGLEIRVYDDAVAFRYLLDNLDDQYIKEEVTSFTLPLGGRAFMMPYDDVGNWTPSYENYFSQYQAGENSPLPNGWCFPALYETENQWVLLTEAGPFDAGYASHLEAEVEDGSYAIKLPEPDEALGLYSQSAFMKKTPWRVIIAGDLNTIVNANTVKLLAPETKIENTSWIVPGRAAWSWLSDHDSPKDFEKQLKFVDMAAEMGWEYCLVDANWQEMQGGNVNQLVEYATNKKVGLLLWYNSAGKHNTITEAPRELMSDPILRKREFHRIHEMGIKGVKIDFFQSDKPKIMKLYLDILEDASEFQLLVNFHGCTIPRGWEMMYPNLMTMESVKGAECYTFAPDYPDKTPVSSTILPFTRNVIGSMDYTPVIFSDFENPHLTSNAHELALAILFESGITHFSDAAESYLNQSEGVKSFLSKIPTVWDETVVLDSDPGSHAMIARRKGEEWYIAGINGEDKEALLKLDFHFLDQPVGEGSIIVDEDQNLVLREFYPNLVENIIALKPFGGFVLHFTEEKTDPAGS